VTYTLPGQTPTTCSFTVTVTDDEAPTVTCPGASSNGLSGGSCSMAVSGLNATYSDNCTGSTLAYALSGATTGSGSGQATGATFQAGVTTVTYTVTAAVGNPSACSSTVTVTVLQATVGTTDNSGAQLNDGVVCNGLKATLTSVSTGTVYNWSNGETTQSITVTPAGAETYTVTVTLGAGCTTTGQASVNVPGTATMNAVPAYGPLCPNDTLSVPFGSGLSGVTYAWRDHNPNVRHFGGQRRQHQHAGEEHHGGVADGAVCGDADVSGLHGPQGHVPGSGELLDDERRCAVARDGRGGLGCHDDHDGRCVGYAYHEQQWSLWLQPEERRHVHHPADAKPVVRQHGGAERFRG